MISLIKLFVVDQEIDEVGQLLRGFDGETQDILHLGSVFVDEPFGQVGLGQEKLLGAAKSVGLIDRLEKLDDIAPPAGAHRQNAGLEADVFRVRRIGPEVFVDERQGEVELGQSPGAYPGHDALAIGPRHDLRGGFHRMRIQLIQDRLDAVETALARKELNSGPDRRRVARGRLEGRLDQRLGSRVVSDQRKALGKGDFGPVGRD